MISDRISGQRDGFSLAELAIAVVILAFGILAMGGATSHFFTQARVADSQTERTAAIEQAAEIIRAIDFGDMASRAQTSPLTLNGYQVWWSARNVGSGLFDVMIYTSGRGYLPGSGWSPAVIDSFPVSVSGSLQ